jgi:hypothetical protein
MNQGLKARSIISFETVSLLPHSEGFASQKLCGIGRDGGDPRTFGRHVSMGACQEF